MKPIKGFPGNVKAVLLVLRREHLRDPATSHLGKFEHFTDCDELYLWICPAAGLFLQQLSSFQQESSRLLLVVFQVCSPLWRPSMSGLIFDTCTLLWFKQLLPYWADILL